MRAVARADRALIPASVLLTVTHRCQLNCAHCYQAKHESDDLSTEEMVALLDELALLGTLNLTFTGGEALLRKDLLQLVAEARKRSFAVTLFSNGGPITEAIAQRLRELRVMAVEISIHGSHAATHDGFVGRQGSFARAVRAVELLDDQGVPVLVKSSIVRCNAEEIFELEALFAARPRVQFMSDVLLHARDDGRSTLHERATPEQMHAHFAGRASQSGAEELAGAARLLANRPSESELDQRRPCGAGRSFASIQPNGDVLACVQMPTMKMGNLREKRFSEMWLDSPPVRALRALTLEKFSECRGCEYRHVCSKCPALSLDETGRIEGHSRQICEKTKTFWGAIQERLAASSDAGGRLSSEPRGLSRILPAAPGCAIDRPRKRFPLRVVGA